MHLPAHAAVRCLLRLFFPCLTALALTAYAADSDVATPAPPALRMTEVRSTAPYKERVLVTLKRENLSQSFQEIITGGIEQFCFPGTGSGYYGRDSHLWTLLSNRRVIKVMQDIKALPEGDRGSECDRLFANSFQAHSNACRTVILHEQNPSLPKNGQSMFNTVMGLSTALFVTAEIGRLDLLGKQFETLDAWTKEIEPLAYVPSPNPGHGTLLDNEYVAPDYQLQVNMIRLGVLRAGNPELLKQVDLELASIGMKTNSLPIVPWNAGATAFEWFLGPLDTSKGVTKYTFYDWTKPYTKDNRREDREMQKPFVDRLRSIAFNKGITR